MDSSLNISDNRKFNNFDINHKYMPKLGHMCHMSYHKCVYDKTYVIVKIFVII